MGDFVRGFRSDRVIEWAYIGCKDRHRIAGYGEGG